MTQYIINTVKVNVATTTVKLDPNTQRHNVKTSGSSSNGSAQQNKDLVIFDGECNFCQSQIRLIRRLDLGGQKLEYRSLHEPSVSDEFPELDLDALMRAMHIVDRNSQIHIGSDAVKYLARRLPLLWIFVPLLHLPGTGPLWKWMYQFIAKNRYRLAGKKCDTGSCHLD